MGRDNERQFGGFRPSHGPELALPRHPAVRPLTEAAHQAAGAHCFLQATSPQLQGLPASVAVAQRNALSTSKGGHMKKAFGVLISMFILAISSKVIAGPPSGSAYIDGGTSKVAVILCHGRAQHPRWKVVDPLRKEINKQLGYHALSLQMPGKGKDWEKYAEEFPRAYGEIQAGIDFLRKEKGVTKIYLMGHSMGSRMATAFLAENPDSDIAGFIGVGIKNGGKYPLDSKSNLRKIKIPVLDVYGNGGDGQDKIEAEARADMVSERYKQILIPNADHVFDTGEEGMVKAVVDWLAKQAQ